MKPNKQIVGLDALRFLAALFVVGFHLCFLHGSNDPGGVAIPAYAVFKPFTYFGWVGVEIFFVLSGFVIAYSAQGVTARLFFQHRVVRLLPGVLICGTITAIVRSLCTNASARDLASSWLRSVIFSPKGPWIDNSYWTLSIEVAFYALIMLLLYLNRMDRLQLVIGTLGAISSLLWIAAISHAPLGERFLSSIVSREPLNVLLLRHGCYFAIGVLLWLSLFHGVTMLRSLLLLLCAIGGVAQIVFRTGSVNNYSGYAFTPTVPIAVWLLSLAFIVFSVRANDVIVQRTGLRGSYFLRRVGLMTYPLYLLHADVGLALSAILRGYLSPRVALATAIAAVILAAYLISVYLEPPLQRLVRRILSNALPMRLAPETTTVPKSD